MPSPHLNARLQLEASKRAALDRAGNRCEGSPNYPDCRAKNGQAHPVTDKTVRLSVIHLTPGDDAAGNLRVMCERCLLAYDFPAHRTNDWRGRRRAMGNIEMFPIEDPRK